MILLLYFLTFSNAYHLYQLFKTKDFVNRRADPAQPFKGRLSGYVNRWFSLGLENSSDCHLLTLQNLDDHVLTYFDLKEVNYQLYFRLSIFLFTYIELLYTLAFLSELNTFLIKHSFQSSSFTQLFSFKCSILGWPQGSCGQDIRRSLPNGRSYGCGLGSEALEGIC